MQDRAGVTRPHNREVQFCLNRRPGGREVLLLRSPCIIPSRRADLGRLRDAYDLGVRIDLQNLLCGEFAFVQSAACNGEKQGFSAHHCAEIPTRAQRPTPAVETSPHFGQKFDRPGESCGFSSALHTRVPRAFLGRVMTHLRPSTVPNQAQAFWRAIIRA